jgi:hypothetical protein
LLKKVHVAYIIFFFEYSRASFIRRTRYSTSSTSHHSRQSNIGSFKKIPPFVSDNFLQEVNTWIILYIWLIFDIVLLIYYHNIHFLFFLIINLAKLFVKHLVQSLTRKTNKFLVSPDSWSLLQIWHFFFNQG